MLPQIQMFLFTKQTQLLGQMTFLEVLVGIERLLIPTYLMLHQFMFKAATILQLFLEHYFFLHTPILYLELDRHPLRG